MRRLLAQLAKDGHTVLLSSHLLGEVQEICDRVGVISRGRLITEATVDELRGESGLVVRADPVDKAVAVAGQVAGESNVSIVDGAIRLALEPGRAAQLNRELVRAGVDVYEIRPVERSLEEVFFEMTSGEEER